MSYLKSMRFVQTILSLSAEELNILKNDDDLKDFRDLLGDLDSLTILGKSREELKEYMRLLLNNQRSVTDVIMLNLEPVSEPLNEYLLNILDDIKDQCFYQTKVIAVNVCQFGNRITPESSVIAFKAINHRLDEIYIQLHKDIDTDLCGPNIGALISEAQYLNDILEVCDAFVTASIGAVLGAEEHYPDEVDEIGENIEALAGMEHGEECQCGCNSVNAPHQFLQGYEDYLSNRDTVDAQFAISELMRTGALKVDGMEGPALDKIKDAAKAVIATLTDALKTMKDSFFNKTDQEMVDAAKAAAETNKKGLNAIPGTSPVYPKPKEGIIALAKSVDPDGDMPGIVSNMDDAAAGMRVIDGLLGYMNKQVTTGSDLQKAYDAAKSAVDNLKKVSGKAGGSEDNKDVNAEIKTQVNEATSGAKDSFADARAVLKKHRKLMSGILKAIKNTTANNFKHENQKPAKEEEESNE